MRKFLLAIAFIAIHFIAAKTPTMLESDMENKRYSTDSIIKKRSYFSIGHGIGFIDRNESKRLDFMLLNLSFGSAYMNNARHGVRFYGDFGVRLYKAYVGGNVDYIYNFYGKADNSFRMGLTAGLGLAAGQYSSKDYLLNLHVNAGLKAVWYQKYGLELMLRTSVLDFLNGGILDPVLITAFSITL